MSGDQPNWREYRSRLRAYIGARVRQPDAVDDILQDVFVRALAAIDSLQSSGSLAPWLYRIAANAIADHYRSQRPGEQLPDDLAAPEPADDPVAGLAACLQPLIDDLPDTYRSALMLSELQGLPQRLVAERLGISLSGAKSRVQRGRRLLRERVLACCEIETGRDGIVDYRPRDPACGGRSC